MGLDLDLDLNLNPNLDELHTDQVEVEVEVEVQVQEGLQPGMCGTIRRAAHASVIPRPGGGVQGGAARAWGAASPWAVCSGSARGRGPAAPGSGSAG